jgi:regulation of enolase protein 1 (concanavalin A-like superfamily)
MSRFFAVVFWFTAAVAALAAPAPFPRSSGPWFDGWDKPIDPLGDSVFNRSRGQLTITSRGKGQALPKGNWEQRAPCLLRDVTGDFQVQVRIARLVIANHAHRRARWIYGAGLLLTDSKQFVFATRDEKETRIWAGRAGAPTKNWSMISVGPPRIYNDDGSWTPVRDDPAWLRLERRGNQLIMRASSDGEKWETSGQMFESCQLSPKLKVGVFALATDDDLEKVAQGTFKAVFDQFKLTPVAKPRAPHGAWIETH